MTITSEIEVRSTSVPADSHSLPRQRTAYTMDKTQKNTPTKSASQSRASPVSNTTTTLVENDDLEPAPTPAAGTQFLEDPRWRKSVNPGRPKTAGTLRPEQIDPDWAKNIHHRERKGADIGAKATGGVSMDMNSPDNKTPLLQDSSHDDIHHPRKSTDAGSFALKHPLCRMLPMSSITIIHTGQRFRNQLLLQRARFSKSIRRIAYTSEIQDTRQADETKKPGMLKQVKVHRRVRSKRRMENLRNGALIVDGGDPATENNVVNLDNLSSTLVQRDDLADMLHNPVTLNRFSDEWSKFVNSVEEQKKFEQSLSRDGNNRLPKKATMEVPFDGSFESHSNRVTIGAPAQRLNNADDSGIPRNNQNITAASEADRHGYWTPRTPRNDAYQGDINSGAVTNPDGEQVSERPQARPKTSSGIGTKIGRFMKQACMIENFDSISSSIPDNNPERRAMRADLPAAISKVDKRDPKFSIHPLAARGAVSNSGPNPSASTDTLTEIEAQVQVRNERTPLMGVSNVALIFSSMQASRSPGPSSDPPERPLPKLPVDHQKILAEQASWGSQASSRSRRASKRASAGARSAQTDSGSAGCALTTLRARTPVVADPKPGSSSTGKPSRLVRGTATNNNLQSLRVDIPSTQAGIIANPDLRSPTSLYSEESAVSSRSHTTALPSLRSARVDRVRALRKRDLSFSQSHSAHRRIDEEEDESSGAGTSATQPNAPAILERADPNDQFPVPPPSRPPSRTHHRKTDSNPTPQNVAQSSIIVLAETMPVTIRLRREGGVVSPSPSPSSSASMPDLALSNTISPRKTPKSKISQRSIGSNLSNAMAPPPPPPTTAPHTPPSSGESARNSANLSGVCISDIDIDNNTDADADADAEGDDGKSMSVGVVGTATKMALRRHHQRQHQKQQHSHQHQNKSKLTTPPKSTTKNLSLSSSRDLESEIKAEVDRALAPYMEVLGRQVARLEEMMRIVTLASCWTAETRATGESSSPGDMMGEIGGLVRRVDGEKMRSLLAGSGDGTGAAGTAGGGDGDDGNDRSRRYISTISSLSRPTHLQPQP